MAIAATVEWEVRTTATAGNVNGGGYKPGASGTDFSQQNAAQYNLTLVTTAGADAVLLSASAAADMVGNTVRIVSGTNFTVGWYEIISVVVGTSITLDRNCTTAAGSAGVVNIGGAMSLASTLDDDFFEALEPGNTVHIKSGTYTLGEAVSMAKDGTSLLPINIVGYDAARNDNPTGSGRPLFAVGANAMLFGDYVFPNYLRFTTTAASGVDLRNATGRFLHANNSSGTAGRIAFRLADRALLMSSEAQSVNGVGIAYVGVTSQYIKIFGNYIHDCGQVGVDLVSGADGSLVAFNIIDTCAIGIEIEAGTDNSYVVNNTLYNGTTGISNLNTVADNILAMNNIISTFTTGLSAPQNTKSNTYQYNTIHNCTTPRTNVDVGLGDDTLDPAFTDAPNGNFAVGANMKAVAFPGAFSGGLSTGYLDIGAVQRQEPAGGGPVSQLHVKFQPNY